MAEVFLHGQSGGGIKINGEIESYQSLNNIAKGEFVSRGYKDVFVKTPTLLTGINPVQASSLTKANIVKMSDSMLLMVYRQSSSGYGAAVIGTLSSGSDEITWGMVDVFASVSVWSLSAVKLSSSQCLVVFQDANNNNFLRRVFLTIDGSTVSHSTATAVVGIGDQAYATYLCSISPTTVLSIVSYSYSGNYRYDASILTISGTTVTANTAVMLETGMTNLDLCHFIKYSDFSLMVGYQSYVRMLSISGTTVTASATASTGYHSYDLIDVSSTMAISLANNGAYPIAVSGTTLTVSPVVPITGLSGGISYMNGFLKDSNTLIVCLSTIDTYKPTFTLLALFDLSSGYLAFDSFTTIATSAYAAVPCLLTDRMIDGKRILLHMEQIRLYYTILNPYDYPVQDTSICIPESKYITSSIIAELDNSGESPFSVIVPISLTQTRAAVSHSASGGLSTDLLLVNSMLNKQIMTKYLANYSLMQCQNPVIRLSSSRAILLCTNTSGYACAVVVSFDNDRITYGIPVVFHSASLTIGYVRGQIISDTKILVTYPGSSAYGTAVVLSINDTTVSVGTPAVFLSETSNLATISELEINKFLLTYTRNSSSFTCARVITISDSSITMGSQIDIVTGQVSFGSVTLEVLSANQAVVAYYVASDANRTRCVGLSVDGTTIILGTPLIVYTYQCYGAFFNNRFKDNRAVLIVPGASSIEGLVIEVSNNVVSLISSITLAVLQTDGYLTFRVFPSALANTSLVYYSCYGQMFNGLIIYNGEDEVRLTPLSFSFLGQPSFCYFYVSPMPNGRTITVFRCQTDMEGYYNYKYSLLMNSPLPIEGITKTNTSSGDMADVFIKKYD